MGVHDNLDSKYSAVGRANSNFPKFGGIKRPAAQHAPKDAAASSKLAKRDKQGQSANNGAAGGEACSSSSSSSSSEEPSQNLQQERKSLPVYRLRKRLLEEIRKHSTLIVIGETGSGKTTQIPQLLLSAGLAGAGGRIGVTSPRRVAAVSVARRVAQELNSAPGRLVGYCVRFEDATSEQTRIKYLTDGMLVREAMTDEVLSDYAVIVLDEAHERSVQTDVLLGVARRAQKLRRLKALGPLRLLVMSATMDVDKFARYFQAPAIYLEGRQHQVLVLHARRPQDDYAFSALATALRIHRQAPPNEDILIFLTGQEEIEAAARAARQAAKLLDGEGFPALKVLSLYSALPTQQQLEAFRPSAPGTRKLVLATNVAETSVTIGGIRHVIDTGMVKQRTHHPTTGMDVLRVDQISKAQAWQRTGRAGREAAGKCYRTYTSQQFQQLKDMPLAEIQRCSLAGVALQLLAIGIDITSFDFMDRPPADSIDAAVACLEKLGAVKGTPPQLTTLGRTMSLFPLDPRFSKVLLASVEHKCLEEALTVMALLSGESVFLEPPAKRQQAAAARSRFASEEGDHVTLLNVFKGFVNAAAQRKLWCHENFLHHRNLEYAMNVRKQLAALTDRAKLEKSSCGNNTESLRRALFDGLTDNLAELQRDQNYVAVASRQAVAIHPSSVLHGTKPQLVLFTEVVLTGRCYIRGLSVIDSTWLKDRSGPSGRHD